MTLPTLFVSHGSPMLALTPSRAQTFLKGLGATLGRPEAIVVASPHFPAREPVVVADPKPTTIYDFGGFAPELYRITYPAPGNPGLAAEVAGLIRAAGLPAHIIDRRGFDHGTWVPFSLIWPDASVPVVQLSIEPERDAAYHFELGRALAPLRERGVLVVGTGAMTHNLRELFAGGMRDVNARQRHGRRPSSTGLPTAPRRAPRTISSTTPSARRRPPAPIPPTTISCRFSWRWERPERGPKANASTLRWNTAPSPWTPTGSSSRRRA